MFLPKEFLLDFMWSKHFCQKWNNFPFLEDMVQPSFERRKKLHNIYENQLGDL
jgi:hypothetical protein